MPVLHGAVADDEAAAGDADAPAIATSLRGLGYEAVVPFVAFHGAHAARLAPRFWLTHRRVWEDHRADLDEAAARETLKMFDDLGLLHELTDADIDAGVAP